MDLTNALRTVIPTVDADVLSVLTGTRAPLTGARVAALAGRSYAQVRAVLHRLVANGVVERERHGNAYSYLLNRAHVTAEPLERLAAALERVEHWTAEAAGAWDPPAHAVVVFGSFARRDGDHASDIDVLVVRPDAVGEEHEEWVAQRYRLARELEARTGNTVQIVELSATELSEAVAAGDALVAALRRDGHVLVGPRLPLLLASAEEASP